MRVVNVIMRKRNDKDVGPSYVTICMAGHWDGKDGIMQTSGTWDATKFDLEDKDVYVFCEYLNRTSESEFEVVPIDTRHLSTRRNEYWSDNHVHCDFKKNRLFKGVKLDIPSKE